MSNCCNDNLTCLDDMSTCCNDMSTCSDNLTCCDDMSICCSDNLTCFDDISTCCNDMYEDLQFFVKKLICRINKLTCCMCNGQGFRNTIKDAH